MNRAKYMGDGRYERVLERMDLLGIMDVSTTRQARNGTIVWKLPIKNNWNNGKLIEVASFKTGYVRNQNSGYSNYQLNKRCESEPDYYKIERNGETLYRKFTTRTCKLIPIEIDRLEYLISYCLKNYYIKRANEVADGKFIPKWRYEYDLKHISKADHYDKINELEEKLDAMTDSNTIKETRITNLSLQNEVLQNKLAETKVRQDVSVIVNGHRYKVL